MTLRGERPSGSNSSRMGRPPTGAGRPVRKNSPLSGVLELIRLDKGLRDALKADYLRIVERVGRNRELADCVRRLSRGTRARNYLPFAGAGVGGSALETFDARRETLALSDMDLAVPDGPYGP